MTFARTLGLALTLAGLAAGTLMDRPQAREIPRVGDQFVLAGDFHVHAFIGDGGVAPWELAREARRRDLDVIVVSNHNQQIAARIATNPSWRRAGDPIVIAGQEVTAPRFHMVAAGVRDTIDWRLSASEAARAIHAQGGVAIAAHPTPGSWREPDEQAYALLDGAEVAHPGALGSERARRELAEFFAYAGARNSSLAPIGSSDFHFGGVLGLCRTFVFTEEVSERGILEAIRAGRTVAYGGGDRLIGDPARVRAVEALLANRPPRWGPDGPSRLAAWAALAGLFVLLLFR